MEYSEEPGENRGKFHQPNSELGGFKYRGFMDFLRNSSIKWIVIQMFQDTQCNYLNFLGSDLNKTVVRENCVSKGFFII